MGGNFPSNRTAAPGPKWFALSYGSSTVGHNFGWHLEGVLCTCSTCLSDDPHQQVYPASISWCPCSATAVYLLFPKVTIQEVQSRHSQFLLLHWGGNRTLFWWQWHFLSIRQQLSSQWRRFTILLSPQDQWIMNPGKFHNMRNTGCTHFCLFYPNLPDGKGHVNNLVNCTVKWGKADGLTVEQVNFYYHIKVPSMIQRHQVFFSGAIPYGTKRNARLECLPASDWFDWVEVNWDKGNGLNYTVPAILVVLGGNVIYYQMI